jgi:hypothetical protein
VKEAILAAKAAPILEDEDLGEGDKANLGESAAGDRASAAPGGEPPGAAPAALPAGDSDAGEGDGKGSGSGEIDKGELKLFHYAEVKNFALKALGHDLDALELKAAFGAHEIPHLEGELNLKVTDFDLEEKLLGKKLKSSPLLAKFKFTPLGEGREEYSGTIDLKEFSLEDLAELKDTSLSLSVKDPHSVSAYFVSLEEGPGFAGPLLWEKGELKAESLSPGGPLSLLIDFKEKGGAELLFLKGLWNAPGALARLDDLKARPPGLGKTLVLSKPVTLTAGDVYEGKWQKLSLSDLSLSFGETSLSVKGDAYPLNLEMELRDLAFETLRKAGLESIPDGKAHLKASLDHKGQGSFELNSGVEAEDDLGQKLRFDLTATGKLTNFKTLAGDILVNLPGPGPKEPVVLNYLLSTKRKGNFITTDTDGPIKLSLNWTGDARRIWTFAGLSDRTLSGATELDAKIEGSLNRPLVNAALYLSKGIYEDQILGLSLSEIDLEARADQKGDLSVLLSASDGDKGSVALEGKVIFFAESPSLNVRAQIKHLSPLHRDDLELTASGLASITGPFKNLKITAKTVIETAELNLSKSLGGPSIQTLDIASLDAVPRSLGPELDLSVNIPGEAFVRGRGLDSEWNGLVGIKGNVGAPLLSGYLKPTRGYFTFMGKDFIFTGGEISFRNQKKLNPGLNIELTRNVPNLTAILRVQGTLDKPRISFVSNPPFPQDEVLSQVLFNKGASELSRLEALQLANSLRELTGVGPNVPNPLVEMREALGLSVLRFGEASGSGDRHLESNSFRKNLDLDGEQDEGSDAVASTFEAGKYINDKIYVGLEQNLTDNTTGVRVEVELSPKINLTSRTTSNSSRIALGWKHDY